MTGYWVADWLDKNGIKSVETARLRLATDKGLNDAIESSKIAQGSMPSPPASGKNLVAGTGLDLTGHFACGHPECLKGTVDKLVRRSWCYFDRIIVTGLDPVDFWFTAADNRAQATGMLIAAIDVLIFMRKSGVESFFHFRRAMQLCTEHLNKHAIDAGMQPVDEMVRLLKAELRKGGDLQIVNTPNGVRFAFRHPAFNSITVGHANDGLSPARMKTKVIDEQARRFVAELTRSVSLARLANATLGQATSPESKIRRIPSHSDVEAGDVAINISLPFLANAPLGQLLRLRAEDPEEFSVFRGALTKTIEERLKAEPGADSELVAREVVEDVLNPALAALTLRSRKSARLLGARSAGSLAIGGLMTTVGLLQFSPLTLPGLVLASGTLVANYADYLKDRREVDLSDLHFLWRAEDATHA